MEKSEASEPSEVQKLVNKYSPVLTELRKRLMFVLIVFGASTIVGFIFYEKLIKFLVDFLSLQGVNIVFTSPFQFINLSISCGVAVGLIISFPLLVYEIFSFLQPALSSREYKMIVRFLPFCLILFLFGFGFGALIMKWQIAIFLNQSMRLGIGNILDISNLLTVVILTSVLMGISFEFPIILLLLMRIGIIKPSKLSKARPWVYLGSFVFAILLPPDSIIADVLLSLPLIVLFEITLFINRIIEHGKTKGVILEGA